MGLSGSTTLTEPYGSRVEFEAKNRLTVGNIVGFIRRPVDPHGTGAKVTCPKEFLEKTVYLVITPEDWPEDRPRRRRQACATTSHGPPPPAHPPPELLDDYVTAENPVRFIDAFVDNLNGAKGRFPGELSVPVNPTPRAKPKGRSGPSGLSRPPGAGIRAPGSLCEGAGGGDAAESGGAAEVHLRLPGP